MKKLSQQSMTNLANGVLVVAHMRFPGQLPRIWFAMLGKNSFKAYIINSDTKKILASASSNENEQSALNALRVKLSPTIKKAKT